MSTAARDLLSLGPVGLQLTPGCAPTRNFCEAVTRSGVRARTHHGFDYAAVRQPVWEGSRLLAKADSVHPPRTAMVAPEEFLRRAEAGDFNGVALETMYPGHCLGTGDELEAAMNLGLPLAVDVSHVYMQLCQGAMAPSTWQRLQGYEGVVEVHLSSNDGSRDQHRSVDIDTFGFGWAVECADHGTPVVIENYMHRQPEDERRRMVDLVLDQMKRTGQ